MASFIIEGGSQLSGELTPQGAKNEALQVISATLLTPEEVIIHNIPEILDVKRLIDILMSLGVEVKRLGKGSYSFKAEDINIDYLKSDEYMKKAGRLRGSVLIMGPLHSWHVTEKWFYPNREVTK